jgi:dsDNA-binding SOS-regulon protein
MSAVCGEEGTMSAAEELLQKVKQVRENRTALNEELNFLNKEIARERDKLVDTKVEEVNTLINEAPYEVNQSQAAEGFYLKREVLKKFISQQWDVFKEATKDQQTG